MNIFFLLTHFLFFLFPKYFFITCLCLIRRAKITFQEFVGLNDIFITISSKKKLMYNKRYTINPLGTAFLKWFLMAKLS